MPKAIYINESAYATDMATISYVQEQITVSGGTNITNPGNNRVLTSDGTSKGINAEGNLTFDGTTMIIDGSLQVNTITAGTTSNIIYYDTSTSGFTYGTAPTNGVTSVAAGNGLDFSTITGSGTVTLGTPTTNLSSTSTNAVTTSSHTHLDYIDQYGNTHDNPYLVVDNVVIDKNNYFCRMGVNIYKDQTARNDDKKPILQEFYLSEQNEDLYNEYFGLSVMENMNIFEASYDFLSNVYFIGWKSDE